MTQNVTCFPHNIPDLKLFCKEGWAKTSLNWCTRLIKSYWKDLGCPHLKTTWSVTVQSYNSTEWEGLMIGPHSCSCHGSPWQFGCLATGLQIYCSIPESCDYRLRPWLMISHKQRKLARGCKWLHLQSSWICIMMATGIAGTAIVNWHSHVTLLFTMASLSNSFWSQLLSISVVESPSWVEGGAEYEETG